MYFVLVYYCGGMLMMSCFGDAIPIVGRKRIKLPQPWREGGGLGDQQVCPAHI